MGLQQKIFGESQKNLKLFILAHVKTLTVITSRGQRLWSRPNVCLIVVGHLLLVPRPF